MSAASSTQSSFKHAHWHDWLGAREMSQQQQQQRREAQHRQHNNGHI